MSPLPHYRPPHSADFSFDNPTIKEVGNKCMEEEERDTSKRVGAPVMFVSLWMRNDNISQED